jgi:diguanylate cyclase (GGDEF)-like protein
MFDAARRTGLWTGECELDASGEQVPVEMSITAVADTDAGGLLQSYLIELRDLRERRENERRLERLAMFDALTGLPNRLALQLHMEGALNGMLPMFGLLLINLDGFKEVNDSYGHESGDMLLQGVAQRLQAVLPEGAMLARPGNDEFVLVMPPDSGDTEVRTAAQSVLATLARRFEVARTRSPSRLPWARAGAADATTSSQLMRRPRGIRRGPQRLVFYDNSLESDAQRRVRLTSLLREDTERNALIRGPAQGGRPGHAGGRRTADALDDRGLRQRQPGGIHSAGREGGPDPADGPPCRPRRGATGCGLRRAGPPAAGGGEPVAQAAAAAGAGRPAAACLPAAASSRRCSSWSSPNLRWCTAWTWSSPCWAQTHGFKLALDDFGTGYSSLSYLRHLPFDKVKIDRSFVMDVDRDPNAARILESIVGLCAALDMRTVAEGVETEQQLAMLRAMGVTEFQGYWFARPMPMDDWLGLLALAPAADLVLPRR